MRRTALLLAVALLAALTLANAKPRVVEDEGILVLNKRNFKKVLKAHKSPGVVVEFYAPWCAHCKNLAPEYVKAAATLREKYGEGGVRLAKVDVTREKKLGRQYAANGYPTLRYFTGPEHNVEMSISNTNASTVDEWVQRLVGDAPGCGVEREYMEERILAESESLLSKMPGFQQTLTQGVTRQVQKIMILAWRKEWKRALAEYEEEHPGALS